MQTHEYKNKEQTCCSENISDSICNTNDIKEHLYYNGSEETSNSSSLGYGEQKGNMWLLKRSRKGMELNNPHAFNLKPQSLRTVIDRIPLLPYVGCSQLEYVMWRKQIQPCVPDSKYMLHERTDGRTTQVISPKEDIHTYCGNSSIGYPQYYNVPKISKSDCMCFRSNKANKTYSDVYMPVGTKTHVTQSLSKKYLPMSQSLSKKYPPKSHSGTTSLFRSKESSIYMHSAEATKITPLPRRKKKGFCRKFCFCCDDDVEEEFILNPVAQRYVCTETTPCLSGSSLYMFGGELRKRRTRYICRPKTKV